MRRFNNIAVIVVAALLPLPPAPVFASTHKGDKLTNDSRKEESKGNYDKAVALAEQAVQEDPDDVAYLLQLRRTRVEAGYQHLKAGRQLRDQGHLDQAVAEFQKTLSYDPSSDIARQELQRTKEMIDRNNKPAGDSNGPAAAVTPPESDKNLTPVEAERKKITERIDSLLPVPELRPLNDDLIDLKMTNSPRILFETVCKIAGINVLFDPDYKSQQQIQSVQIDLSRTTLEQALDELGVVTKSFWKPLAANTIFVTLDNPQKRRDYEEEVVKVFYLSNASLPTELQEMLTAVRSLFGVTHVMQYASQNAIVVRAPTDTMLLIEKMMAELDKPRSEVLVDVMVMEVSSTYTRNLAAGLAQGLNTSAVFSPRPGITTPGIQSASSTASSTTSTTTTTTTSTPTTTTGTGTASTGVTSVPFSALSHISSADYSVSTLPGATLEAMLSDSSTRVLQAPQIRAADASKATLNIGTKVPTATGSFQPGVAGVGVSPLVNTQFSYLDVGVNLEITPHVNNNDEISLHVAVDISQVANYDNIGGIQEPEIAQNKIATDVRLHEGEVNMISGIIQKTDSRSVTGLPGLANLPIIGHLFNSETKEKDRTELVIVLIPHIVRGPSITASDLEAVASGSDQVIRVTRAPRIPASGQKPQESMLAPGSPNSGAPQAPNPVTTPPATAPPATAPPAPAGPALPGGPARISFLPAVVNTQVNGAFTVNLYAENVNDMLTAAAHLQFDPKVLRITNVVAGDLPQRNAGQLQPTRNILNEVGSADISIARGPNSPGVSGSGGLVSIVFQAVGRGNTSVLVSNMALTSSTGQTIASNTPAPLTVTVQ